MRHHSTPSALKQTNLISGKPALNRFTKSSIHWRKILTTLKIVITTLSDMQFRPSIATGTAGITYSCKVFTQGIPVLLSLVDTEMLTTFHRDAISAGIPIEESISSPKWLRAANRTILQHYHTPKNLPAVQTKNVKN